jgi:plasmid stabilization system protein ParE
MGLRTIEEHLQERVDARRLDAAIDAIFEAVDQVEAFPFSAPPWRATADANFRRLVVEDYVVIYRVDEATSEARILSVRHQKQRPAALDDVLENDPG